MWFQSPSGLEKFATILQHILHVVHSPLLPFVTAIRMAILPFCCTDIRRVSSMYRMFSIVQLVMHKQAQS